MMGRVARSVAVGLGSWKPKAIDDIADDQGRSSALQAVLSSGGEIHRGMFQSSVFQLTSTCRDQNVGKIGIEASKFQARVIMASRVVSRCEWTRPCNSLWDIPHTVRSGWVIVTEKGCVGQGSTGERMVRVLAPSWWGSTDSARHIDTHLPQLPQWPDAVAHCLPTRAGYRNERMPSSRVGG